MWPRAGCPSPCHRKTTRDSYSGLIPEDDSHSRKRRRISSAAGRRRNMRRLVRSVSRTAGIRIVLVPTLALRGGRLMQASQVLEMRDKKVWASELEGPHCECMPKLPSMSHLLPRSATFDWDSFTVICSAARSPQFVTSQLAMFRLQRRPT
ncbi:hypothetical protein BJV78DRAFT_631205 [Lactifluus subvellereus]|nr:hypothetical protein BJV78DRAFT_631205 [Lactifluus subvellereus]